MQQWISVVFGSVLVALGSVMPAFAQNTALVGGGLTALPSVTLGASQLKNGGFEALSGGAPASWSAGSGMAMDQLVKRSGTFSYRATGNFTTATQTLQLRKGIYKLSGYVRTQGVGSGTTNGVRLQFDFRPFTNDWKTTDVISGTRDWTLFELPNLVVTQDATVTIKLENYNNSAGTAWFDDLQLQEQQAKAVDVFMLYPNFRGMLFDDQPQTMKFDVAVTPPGGDFGRYRVTGTLKDEASGQVLATRNFPASANLVAELEGGQMQTGRPYLATFSLVDLSNNATVSTYPAYRVSKAPGSARASMNVSFDAKNRVLVRGVPRFVLGVYDSGSGYSAQDSFWESQLWSATGERRLNDMKINFYLNYWYGEAPADAMKSLMANLQKHGVMYLQTGNCFDKFAAGSNFLINSSDTYVRDLGAHPGSGGYYTIDECQSALIPGAFAQYERLRRLDPDGITFSANFGNPDLALWRDSADIISTDPYPLFGAQPSGGYNHRVVGDWTARARQTVKDSRPIMTVLQFFQFTSQGRWPTLQEMRNHAWMAIVEGARGLWWWSLGDNALKNVCSGWCAEKTGHMNNLKAVVNEIAALEPALLADDAPGALRGNSNPSAIRTKVKLVNGRGYLFAYNTTNAQAGATFTWNTAPGTVTVNAENRTVGASSSSFTDSFGPYQAHVYVIGTGGSAGTGGSGGTDGGSAPPPPTPGAPTVTFSNPGAGATVSGSTTVTLSGSGGSGSGYTYRLSVNGTNVYTGTNGTFSWNTTNVANGSQVLTATVTDSANASGTATRTVTVSNGTTTPPPTPPVSGGLTVALTQPRGGSTLSGTNWAVVWVSGTSGTSNVYTLSAGGRTVGTTTTSSTGPVAIPWNTASVADGSQVLTASVRDAAGRTGSTTATVTLRNGTAATPLTAGFTSPAAGATVSGTVTVGLTAGGGSGYSYRLTIDGVQVATAASYSWNTSAVANGSHTLAVTVTDSAGRTATSSRTVTVSNAASTPTAALKVFITQPTGGATVRGTAWVVLWVEGTSGSANAFALRVGNTTIGRQTTGARGPVTIPWTTSAVANGSHTLTATVRDATGKTGTTSVNVRVQN
jgi:Big-like domain-containing protein